MRAAWSTLLLTLVLCTAGTAALAAEEAPPVAAPGVGGGTNTPLAQPNDAPDLTPLTPVIGVDPTSLDFGSCTLVGQCADLTIDVFNDVNDPTSVLEITNFQVTGGGYTLQAGPTLPVTLPGDGQTVATFTVRFCPANTQQSSGTATVIAAGAINTPLEVALSGAGNLAPVCDAGGPYTGTAGQAVSFDGTGSSDPGGTITSYEWDFGDGSTGSGATPSHTYATAGNYTATLTLTDNCGETSTCEAAVAIGEEPNEPPVCDAGGPYNGTAGQAVSFDGTGSSDPDGTIVSYDWNFGDGTTGSGATPTHTYATPGNYAVSLTVTDNDGASSTCITSANITATPNDPPVCDAGGPYSGTAGQSVSFDGTGSSDPDGTIVSYDWNFGDGSAGSGATPTHTYAMEGTYTVSLTVTDDDGASSTCEATATIEPGPNQDPICDAGGPYSGGVGVAVAFDGTGSSDPDGTIVSYAWDFGDGSTGSGATPTHTYTVEGTYTVSLTVTDDDGASSTCTTTATITEAIPNEPPVCDADGPYAGNPGAPITFDGTGSSDPDGTIVSYAWDFGDGTTGSGATPTHTYASPGVYTVTLTVTDDDAASSTCETSATIGDAAERASAVRCGRPVLGRPPASPISFDGTGSSDPDGTIVSYAWDFGDGSTGSGATPTHTYAAAGTFTVSLTVTDDDGASSTCTTTATISGTGNHAPDCSNAVAFRPELWPPSGQFVRQRILGVTDPDGDPITITIDGVTQDEFIQGAGSGNRCPDARRIGNDVEVRSERSGQGDGRVYEISFTASDGRGGVCSGTVTVCVPHDQSGQPCVDSGQFENSFGPCAIPRGSEGESAELALAATVSTEIVVLDYQLPAAATVQLAVFDVTGRRVAVLENAQQSEGQHQLTWDVARLPSGVYYVRMQADASSLVERIVLVR